MDTPSDARDFDLVLFGATGFVGRLTARELARTCPPGLRVGVAGRDRARVEAVRDDLGPAAAGWSVFVTEATDAEQVSALARRTRVIATTVGPYARYGRALVQACAAAGTHYCDLTGEVLFARWSIETSHDRAARSGARIVHSCGFDSIPSDLGVLDCATTAAAAGHGTLSTTVLHVRRARGGFSGGTIESMREQMSTMSRDAQARRIVSDPYGLSPDRAGEPASSPAPLLQRADGVSRTGVTNRVLGIAGWARRRLQRAVPVGHDPTTGRWSAPFVMAGYNTRVVRRSNALTGWSYGRGLRYDEVVDTGRGVRGGVAAFALTAGMSAMVTGMGLPPVRWVLDRVLPSPGEGPSEETMATGLFQLEIWADTSTGARYRTRVGAARDPGYGGTAVMLAQSALCLAVDEVTSPPGVLTPATAMGFLLIDRLRAQGFTFDTERVG
ncbi:MAG TPA: saccharopine dehydrogenase NADP-binding domain-containing protein [Dermatophilaceae bacterium]|nr:saccharopine dehydrogenase NADP-binding domain-containing protein [Dermatophilaceae bacterium]